MPTEDREGMSGLKTSVGRVVGRRTQTRPCGFDGYDGFVELAEALRGVDRVYRRGVYRFASFEEADEWHTKSVELRPRPGAVRP